MLELGEGSSSLIGTTPSFLVAITKVIMFDVHFKVKKFYLFFLILFYF